MTLTPTSARAIGLLVGLGVVALAISAWQVSRPGTPGLDLVMVSTPSVGLDAEPAENLLNASDMRAGTATARAAGKIAVTNQTRRPNEVRVRALPSDTKLDAILRVRVTGAGETVFDGTLGQLRRWSRESFRLTPHQRTDLKVLAWLPSTAPADYQRVIENVNLQLLGIGPVA